MRVTGFSLFSSLDDEPLNFGILEGDNSTQFAVRSVLGLDAEEIIPRYYGSGAVTKNRFYDFALKPRDIVIRIILTPRFQVNETYSDARDALYRLISKSRTGLLTMYLKSGETVIAQAIGSITKFEAVHFTNSPEVQVTFSCPDGMFRGVSPVSLSSDDLSDASPLRVEDNMSNAPHGFYMQAKFTSTSASLTIQDAASNPDWKFKIIPSGGFLVDDILHLDTNLTDNVVYIERGATTVYLADKIEPGSILPIIFPGVNLFHVAELSGGNFLFDWMAFEYYTTYWGV